MFNPIDIDLALDISFGGPVAIEQVEIRVTVEAYDPADWYIHQIEFINVEKNGEGQDGIYTRQMAGFQTLRGLIEAQYSEEISSKVWEHHDADRAA